MKSICILIALVLSSLSIKVEEISPQQMNLVQLYSDNKGLDQQAKKIAQKYSSYVSLKTCQQDQNLKYLHIGKNLLSNGIIMCNIHAREIITASDCLHWAERYLQKTSQEKVNDLTITLFYNANLNRQKVVKQNVCQRKYDGMDMNRNFPTQFNFYNSPTNSQIYPGKSPIIQPFTSCLQLIAQQATPLFFLDLHSGQNGAIFYQHGYNSRQDRVIAQEVNKRVCDSKCRITTLARDGQAINGHIFADMKVRRNVKYSLLFETYGQYDAQNCLVQFNPMTVDAINKQNEKWSNAIDIVIQQVRKRERPTKH